MEEKRKETPTRRSQEKETTTSSVQSRKLFKRQKKESEEKTDEQSQERARWVQIRLIPIWLRIILVLLLITGIGMLGAYIGYSVVGDGEATAIFKKETWMHIVDIIKGVE